MASLQARLLKPLLRVGSRNAFNSPESLLQERARMEQRDQLAAYMDRGFTRRDETIEQIPCQWIITPQSEPDIVILYLHGGGFCLRTPVMHGQMLARLCAGSSATGLMPDYRLAPEYPFPAAYDDSLQIYQALLERGYDPEKIVIAGDSAGGALTMGTLLQARDAGLPLPACAVMLSPGLGVLKKVDGEEGAKQGALLSAAAVETFGKAIAAHRYPDHPMKILIENDFEGLPPLLFQAGGDEILLQDSIQGAAKAEEAGVNAQLEVYEGMMHVFQIFGWLPEARQALGKASDFIRRNTQS